MRSLRPAPRRSSGLFLVLLLLAGALPVHAEHQDHGSAPAPSEAAAPTPGSAHPDHAHHAHHPDDPGGRAEAPDPVEAHDHDPGEPDAPCPRGPCPAGAPACAITLGPPVLPSLAAGPILLAPTTALGEREPEAALLAALFRPPRGDFVTPHVNHAG